MEISGYPQFDVLLLSLTHARLYLKKSHAHFFYIYRRETGTRLRARICSFDFIEVKIPILSYVIGESVSARLARAYSSLLLIN